MEYVAARLGLVFVKVNGPALGPPRRLARSGRRAQRHRAARRSEKVGLALEMASNVMLYLDDIQHTSPELLASSSRCATPSARSGRECCAAGAALRTCAGQESLPW